MPKIGLVGLGVIGRIYAANLTRAFGPIYVYDSARERMAAVEKMGAAGVGEWGGLGEVVGGGVVGAAEPRGGEGGGRWEGWRVRGDSARDGHRRSEHH